MTDTHTTKETPMPTVTVQTQIGPISILPCGAGRVQIPLARGEWNHPEPVYFEAWQRVSPQVCAGVATLRLIREHTAEPRPTVPELQRLSLDDRLACVEAIVSEGGEG
jgi:hypothetical protein